MDSKNELFKQISSIISRLSNPFISKMKLYSMAIANTNNDANDRHDTYYIASIFGGLNGSGKWTNYLKDIQRLLEQLDNGNFHVWLIELNNDCSDDVFTLHLGLKTRG